MINLLIKKSFAQSIDKMTDAEQNAVKRIIIGKVEDTPLLKDNYVILEFRDEGAPVKSNEIFMDVSFKQIRTGCKKPFKFDTVILSEE